MDCLNDTKNQPEQCTTDNRAIELERAVLNYALELKRYKERQRVVNSLLVTGGVVQWFLILLWRLWVA